MRKMKQIPRPQRARILDLIVWWNNEATPEFRREFQNNFAIFERWAECEAERLIQSAFDED